MIGETYKIIVKAASLKKVKDALVLQDDWCISLGDDAIQMLNSDGKSEGKKSYWVSPEDRLLQIIDGKNCACEPTEMLKLLSTCHEVGAELTLQLGRPTPEVKSLAQLKPPFGQKPPSRQNSIFFLLRSSTDLSFIKSVNGYGPNKLQVWSSSGSVVERLKKAFEHYEHVFCFAMYQGCMWGLLRVASPPDEELYGSVSFWAEDPSDLKMWSWLATNFRVQWLCECEMSVDDLPEFRHGIRNSILFDHGPKDGDCLGDFRGEVKKDEEGWEACWKVANALLKSPPSPHGTKMARQTTPSPSTQAYDEHVARPMGADYCRQNLTAKQTKKTPEPRAEVRTVENHASSGQCGAAALTVH